MKLIPSRRTLSLVLWIIALHSMPTAAAEADWSPPGPAVGARFMNPLDLEDQAGRKRSFSDLAGTRGLTLVFVRSADWCPFCRKQLGELEKRAAAFRAAGYPLVSVSVDEVPLIRKFATAANISFTMLADPTGAVTEDLGIRDPQYPVGSFAHGVPQPGIFVIAKDGRIVAKFFVKGYKVRPYPDAALRAVEELAK